MTAGRLVFPALRWSDATGFAHEEAAIARALAAGAGGFILFGGPRDAVRALTQDLVARAGRPLLLAADLERGAGQQFEGCTELPPPAALAALGDRAVIRAAGALTAGEARDVGVNWVFAPVADLDVLPANPIVQTRAFGADPAAVAAAVCDWVAGCEGAGALACAKHYPGHGRTAVDSHDTLPVVDAPAALLEASDLVPFRAAIAAGVASVMTAHVAFPALDPSGLPATRSPRIVGGLRAAGFDGLVVTDALIMGGAFAGSSEREGTVAALAAGVDVLLYPTDPPAVVAAIEQAVAEGRLPAARVAEALARYERALARATAPRPAAPGVPALDADRVADRLLEAGVVRGRAPVLRAPLELVVVDDDLGGPYAPVPSGHVAAELAALGIPLGPGGSRVVLALAEPRAWKGRGGFGAASRAALAEAVPGAGLVVLLAHRRLEAEVPDGPPVVVAWHRQRLLQRAVARWLRGRLG